MFLSILAAALKGMFCFTGSYSNNIFPDPLSSEEEEYYIKNIWIIMIKMQETL